MVVPNLGTNVLNLGTLVKCKLILLRLDRMSLLEYSLLYRKKKAADIDPTAFSMLVDGTVYAPDWYTIPTVSVHWIYKGVKHGAKKLERLGIIQKHLGL